MRILYLADIRFPLERANGIQTAETCHALAMRGHDVTLLVRPDSHDPPRDPFAFYGLPPEPRLTIARASASTPSGIARRAAATGLARRAAYLAAAMRQVLFGRYDVVLTRDLGAAALLVRWPRFLRPPVVYESHGYAPAVSGARSDLLTGGRSASTAKQRRLAGAEARVWRQAEGYVTITRALADELTARLGARERLAVVPDGVRIASDRVMPDLVRPAGHVPVVAYAGHLYPWKGVEVVLGALTLLPDVRGLIVGGHPGELDLDRLRSLAASQGLTERVTFTGMVDPPRVRHLLADADVLVLPNTSSRISSSYSSPLKLFEYMAAGRPIVASDLPAIREVLRDGENARLVVPGDQAALAAGIRDVVRDRATATRLARVAFEEAAAYAWSARAERLEPVLHGAVGSRGAGA